MPLYCEEHPVEWCEHWDARACDGVPRADGTCLYTDAAAEQAGQDAWDARQADAAAREGA
jgi:hypothetical protein